MKAGAAIAFLLVASCSAAAQQLSPAIGETMNNLRRCMTSTIDDGMAASRRTPPAVLVEQAFTACRTEETAVMARLRFEHPNTDAEGTVAGMKVMMKQNYVQQIIDLRAKRR